jgi:long-chain acyl-CoA synthetase
VDTLLDAWSRTRTAVGDGPILHHFGRSISASTVDTWSSGIAAFLDDAGLEAGVRVAICLQNDPHWLTTLLAVWKAGLIAVPLNPMLREVELAHYLKDSGARGLVTTEEYLRETATAALAGSAIRFVLLDGDGDGEGRVAPTTNEAAGTAVSTHTIGAVIKAWSGCTVPPDRNRPSDVALLSYTSGTTGPPKGAENTHGNLFHNACVMADWFGLDGHDTILGVAPLFHITGQSAELALTILTGAPLILFHRFDPKVALELAERWRATFSVGAITAYLAMLSCEEIEKRDLSTLTKVFTGGAPVSPAIVERFEAATGIYIHNGYGLTESTGPATFTPRGSRSPIDHESGVLSVGRALPSVEVDVVDPESRVSLGEGETGEIVLSGPIIVRGYWNQPEETEHAMPDGRLHTGDIGFLDEGWLFIVDRAKDQINASGFKVWPREVEEVLFLHPGVQEAAVVGRPDPYRGETVVAVVVLKPGFEPSVENLTGFCRDRLAAYKCPRRFEFVEALPKTLTGKVLRRALRTSDAELGGVE